MECTVEGQTGGGAGVVDWTVSSKSTPPSLLWSLKFCDVSGIWKFGF